MRYRYRDSSLLKIDVFLHNAITHLEELTVIQYYLTYSPY